MFQHISRSVISALLVVAISASVNGPSGIKAADVNAKTEASYAVELHGIQGTEIKGYVEPGRDVFVIESWIDHEKAYWTPVINQLPLTLDALTEDGQAYDIPEDWDGKLAGWAFLLPAGTDTRSLSWNEGTPAALWEGASFGWGGFRNQQGKVVISSKDDTRRFCHVPTSERSMSNVFLGTVNINRTEETLDPHDTDQPTINEQSSLAQAATVSHTAQGVVVLRDDFDGQSNVRWDILRADPASLSLTTRPGFLIITTQPGDIIGRVSFGQEHLSDIRTTTI